MQVTSQDCHDAYVQVFNKQPSVSFVVRYSGKLKPFNANVKRQWTTCTFTLSKQWIGVDADFQKGCIQSLLMKLYKLPTHDTSLVDMYHNFVKRLHQGTQKRVEDDELSASFHRVVDEYFDGFFDACTVRWGSASRRTLGYYDYTTDTITLSTLLRGKQELLDFVMYHEMLHKKHKFNANRHKTSYHTAAFRTDEKKFKNFEHIEQQLRRL